MGPFDVALAATLQDPPGALAGAIRRALPALRALYRGVAVATSPPTAASVKRLLAREGMYAGTPAANLRGPLYRLAVRRALATGGTRVHYLDLDRARASSRPRCGPARATGCSSSGAHGGRTARTSGRSTRPRRW